MTGIKKDNQNTLFSGNFMKRPMKKENPKIWRRQKTFAGHEKQYRDFCHSNAVKTSRKTMPVDILRCIVLFDFKESLRKYDRLSTKNIFQEILT